MPLLIGSIANFVGTLGVVAQLFGSQKTGELMILGGTLIGKGAEAIGELQLLTLQVQNMAAEGRGPTESEWDAWTARSDAASRTIQNALKV